MPRFEQEDEQGGVRFFQLDLDGPRVVIHRGRSGGKTSEQVIEHRSEASARADLDRRANELSGRGYERVRNEQIARDAEAERKKQLGQAQPLSASPRYRFTHERARMFVWVEARGAALLIAEGPLGEEGTRAPKSEPCGSPGEATRRRDSEISRLLGRGYKLASVDTAADRPARPRAAALQATRELEEAIRRAPGEASWLALEEWLIAQGDPRAELVRHERAGDHAAEALARGPLLRQLLGPEKNRIESLLLRQSWRAGFLRGCDLDLPERRPLEALEAFSRAPAASLLASLGLFSVPWNELRGALELLGASSFASCLTSLSLMATDVPLLEEGLESLPSLRVLELLGEADLAPTPALKRLRRLWLWPSSRELLEPLFSAGGLGELVDLRLDARDLERRGTPLRASDLAALFDGTAAPRLERLEIGWASHESAGELLAALCRSPLPRHLRSLSFGGEPVPGTERPAALARLEVFRGQRAR